MPYRARSLGNNFLGLPAASGHFFWRAHLPSKTAKQHRAMEAAAHGKSTLSIPQKVGKEFIAADSKKKKKPITLSHIGGRPGPKHTVLS